jgi:hypothetical protein
VLVVAVVAVVAVLGLAGCPTQTVELLPDRGAADASEAGPGDGLPPSEAVVDAPLPDTTPPCVCRFIDCRTSVDCTSTIGPTSTCVGTTCTGGTGSCKQTSDCGSPTSWACTTSSSSTAACPP